MQHSHVENRYDPNLEGELVKKPLQELFEEIAPQFRSIGEGSLRHGGALRDFHGQTILVEVIIALARKQMTQISEAPQEEIPFALHNRVLPTSLAKSPEELEFFKKHFGAEELTPPKPSLQDLFDMVSKRSRALNDIPEEGMVKQAQAIDLLEDVVLYLAKASFSPLPTEVEVERLRVVHLPSSADSIRVFYQSGIQFLSDNLGAIELGSHYTPNTRKRFP